ncbi:MAG TPA: hypothetical protein VFF65_02345, partial [Phycisphaerales bacterium]|nr:hypothetical protein [Phycisphaerales bacterium]
MEQESGIPVELERRLAGLATGPVVPGAVDRAVLARAERELAARRGGAGGWVGRWRPVAAAAVIGVVAGVVFVAAVRRGEPSVDMVDALLAARRGASEVEVRQMEAAAVAVRAARG